MAGTVRLLGFTSLLCVFIVVVLMTAERQTRSVPVELCAWGVLEVGACFGTVGAGWRGWPSGMGCLVTGASPRVPARVEEEPPLGHGSRSLG